MKKTIIVTILLLSLANNQIANAQKLISGHRVLKLTNLMNPKKVKYFTTGCTVQAIGDSVKLKGTLESIGTESLFINNREIKFTEIKFLKIITEKRANFCNGIILSGAILVGGGCILIYLAYSQDDGFAAFFYFLDGIVCVGGGIAVSTVGIAVKNHGAKFDLTKNWSVSSEIYSPNF
jgi:hypothetical protein